MSLANFEDQGQGSTGEPSPVTIGRMGPGSTVATPEEFVARYDGKRVINKILIANNGIAGTFGNCSLI